MKTAPLLAGAASAKITPPRGTPMGGYVHRTHGCTGALDDLRVSALCLDDQRQVLVVVGADLVFFSPAITTQVRARLTRALPDQKLIVLLNASHTHCGPHTAENLLDFPGRRMAAYVRFLTDTIVRTVRRAYAQRQPAELRWRTARARLAMNRRRIVNGVCHFAPNPRGPTDPVARIWSVHPAGDRRARPLAVWFSYSCHPTTHSGYEISAEWPGHARRAIERALPGTVALFTQGTCGELRPPWRPGRAGTPAQAQAMGRRLAAVVLRAVKRGRPLPVRLRAAHRLIRLPFARWPNAAELRRFAAARVDPAWCRRHLPAWTFLVETDDAARASRRLRKLWVARMRSARREGRRGKPLALEAARAELSPGHVVLALAGEICFDLARQIRRRLRQPSLTILGYTNDGPAYIPSEKIRREGGYEGATSQFYFAQPSPFAPGLERRVIRGLQPLLSPGGKRAARGT